MIDMLEEIFSSIRKNKLRTFLTGFSVGWGIFMLIILLGAGNGLGNAVISNFNFNSVNSMTIYPGNTSDVHGGLQKNRQIKLKTDDAEYLSSSFPQTIKIISPVITLWNATVSTNNDFISSSVEGVYPQYSKIKYVSIYESNGRFLNQQDISENRKVIVIHKNTIKKFTKETDLLGKYLKINGIPFLVVGIYDTESRNQNYPMFIPFTTMETIFKPDKQLANLSFELSGIENTEDADLFKSQLKSTLGRKHHFSKDDQTAIWIWDRISNYITNMSIFNAINLFIWIIGIGTLIGGVVGIGNIMLITVKERTREFGVRKALGASPLSIIRLVITESIFITVVFGYIGLMLGVGLIELIAMGMNQAPKASSSEDHVNMFSAPSVDINIILSATLILIIAGVIAGYIPSKRAVSIKPVEALKGE